MKKTLFVIASLVFAISVTWTGYSFAQSATTTRTLQDYGISKQAAKYLTPAMVKDILSSPLPTGMRTAPASVLVGKPTPPNEVFGSSTVVSGDGKLPDVVNCFDYYHFGSVQAHVMLKSSKAVPGMSMDFFGNITNSNSYPVVDGTLYVKVMKVVSAVKEANGPDVIDEFVAMENVNISASSSVPLAFTWHVPLYVTNGNYRIVTYFITDKKFNLSGLSFTDDVTGNSFDFNVVGSSKKTTVAFDKTSVTINGNPYFFAAFPPQIAPKDSAKIVAKIVNDTDADEVISIRWNLYNWDSINSDNFIRTIPTSTFVKKHSSANVSLNIPDKDFPVYYFVGELDYRDTKSILNIRYVRAGVDKLKLNFPSVTQFPILNNASSTIFSCVYNSGTSSIVPNGKVVMELKDSRGNIVDNYTYTGPITGAMMAVKNDFISKITSDNFTLHTEVWQDGKISDQVDVVYNCNLIDPSKCIRVSTFIIVLYSVLAVIVLGLILVGLNILLKKRKLKEATYHFLWIFILLPMGVLAAPNVIHADTVSQSGALDPIPYSGTGKIDGSSNDYNLDQFEYFWNWNNNTYSDGSGWTAALDKGLNWTVDYNVEVRNASTSVLINSGDSVPVGTNLTLKILPHKYTDIHWEGTGYSLDSPYGDWGTDPGPVSCKSKDFVNSVTPTWNLTIGGHVYTLSAKFDAYIPLMVAPPAEKIVYQNSSSTSPALRCGNITGNEKKGYAEQCVVVNPGNFNVNFNFDQTQGNFYYRYWDYRTDIGFPPYWHDYRPAGCYGNNVPIEDRTVGQDFRGNSRPGVIVSITVPNTHKSYDLTAIPSNGLAPYPPVIDGPATLNQETFADFGFKGGDPSGEDVAYGIDWDMSGSVEQWLPTNSYVASGTTATTSNKWPTPGDQPFEALTINRDGLTSIWSTSTVSIVQANNYPPTAPDFGVSCGVSMTQGSQIISMLSTNGGGQLKYDVTYYTQDPNNPGQLVPDLTIPAQSIPSDGTYVSSGTTGTTSVSGSGTLGVIAEDISGATSTEAFCDYSPMVLTPLGYCKATYFNGYEPQDVINSGNSIPPTITLPRPEDVNFQVSIQGGRSDALYYFDGTPSSSGTWYQSGEYDQIIRTFSGGNSENRISVVDQYGDQGSVMCPTVYVPSIPVDNNICVAPSHATLCADHTSSVTPTGVSDASKCDASKCNFYCNDINYHLNSSGTACVKSTTIEI